MELNSFEKIIATRNLRESMDKVSLGIFDQQHLQAIHQQMCQNLEHRKELSPGRIQISSMAMDSLARTLGDNANAVLGVKHKEEAAQALAKSYVATVTENPFSSFNKQVAMLIVDGMSKSSGNVIDWKMMDSKKLDQVSVGPSAVREVSNMLENAMTPTPKMEPTKLERKEVHYMRQKQSSNDPSMTARTYLLG